MTTPDDESPYRPPRHQPTGTGEQTSPTYKLTQSEWVVVILVGIVVAIPTFFTTCIGGGLALFSLDIGTQGYGFNLLVNVCLWGISFALACYVGFIAARLLKQWRQRKASSKEN